MTPTTLIEQELAAAQAAQQDGNHGKARVCVRRAVAHATETWLARLSLPEWRGDAMASLRQIQQGPSLPLPIRQAAERLSSSAAAGSLLERRVRVHREEDHEGMSRWAR